jgi:hypothetical protein
MSTVDIVSLTQSVKRLRRHSTPEQRLSRLKEAGLLKDNGELSPNYYPKNFIHHESLNRSDKSV